MVIDVDALSDAELRMKLIEVGFPVMPITGTTRKIMAKKLRMLLENQAKIVGGAQNSGGGAGSAARHSLSRYSSGEEDSGTEAAAGLDAGAKKRQPNRRITMAVPPVTAAARKVMTSIPVAPKRIDSTSSEKNNDLLRRPTIVSPRSVRMVTMAASDESSHNASAFETGSDDSEPELPPSPLIKPKKHNLNTTTTRTTTTEKRHRVTSNNGDMSSSYLQSTASGADAASEHLNHIRSRLSLSGMSSYEPPKLSPEETVGTDGDTPFLSNFMRNHSRMSSAGLSSPTRGGAISDYDNTLGSPYQRRFTSRARSSYLTQATEQAKSASPASSKASNAVSYAVVALAMMFFIVVGVLYLGMHNGSTGLDTSGSAFPRCNEKDTNSKRFDNCLADDDVSRAVHVHQWVRSTLATRTVTHFCSDATVQRVISLTEVHQNMKNHPASTLDNIPYDVRSFVLLALANPTWKIDVAHHSADILTDPAASRIHSVDDLPPLSLKPAQPGFVADSDANPDDLYFYLRPDDIELPFVCRWRVRLASTVRAIAIVSALTALVFGGRRLYRAHRMKTQRHRDEVYLMVERIVELLQTQASDVNNASSDDGGLGGIDKADDFLVVNHVRDMIIPITDRKRQEKTWRDAVQFLNENESRVRTEVRMVQGEQYEVWRWLGGLNTSASSNKSWQGQAFETQAGAVNSLNVSPTPCLKVRGMLPSTTPGAALKQNHHNGNTGSANTLTNYASVREAVLSKVAHRCQLLHCAVDSDTSAIYLRCGSEADAGVAYRALHGWWYAGHLVTVKYLRVERYMQRFPEAPSAGPPYLRALQPATDE